MIVTDIPVLSTCELEGEHAGRSVFGCRGGAYRSAADEFGGFIGLRELGDG